jgi:hypothetical protein
MFIKLTKSSGAHLTFFKGNAKVEVLIFSILYLIVPAVITVVFAVENLVMICWKMSIVVTTMPIPKISYLGSKALIQRTVRIH